MLILASGGEVVRTRQTTLEARYAVLERRAEHAHCEPAHIDVGCQERGWHSLTAWAM